MQCPSSRPSMPFHLLLSALLGLLASCPSPPCGAACGSAVFFDQKQGKPKQVARPSLALGMGCKRRCRGNIFVCGLGVWGSSAAERRGRGGVGRVADAGAAGALLILPAGGHVREPAILRRKGRSEFGLDVYNYECKDYGALPSQPQDQLTVSVLCTSLDFARCTFASTPCLWRPSIIRLQARFNFLDSILAAAAQVAGLNPAPYPIYCFNARHCPAADHRIRASLEQPPRKKFRHVRGSGAGGKVRRRAGRGREGVEAGQGRGGLAADADVSGVLLILPARGRVREPAMIRRKRRTAGEVCVRFVGAWGNSATRSRRNGVGSW
ncbi:hypothetical protein GALMADRAFT_1049138 [Galerina marginata CBS 339.88]|uniref:Uncharacterized protein n=1 Tax=Galerina marginata (strain CBS 339.88) TaxID=685588 RepID=A0A067SN88_GALM3|nr:hypothetical protein GALMADRAFT_1049138 [Galerina marginata CBS 339.88]